MKKKIEAKNYVIIHFCKRRMVVTHSNIRKFSFWFCWEIYSSRWWYPLWLVFFSIFSFLLLSSLLWSFCSELIHNVYVVLHENVRVQYGFYIIPLNFFIRFYSVGCLQHIGTWWNRNVREQVTKCMQYICNIKHRNRYDHHQNYFRLKFMLVNPTVFNTRAKQQQNRKEIKRVKNNSNNTR